MGGSGGGGYLGGGSPKDLADKLRRAEQESKGEALAPQVDALLGEVLADANDRDTDANTQHLEEIRAALQADTEDIINLYFGGSVSKHTYVEGISDVDALVVLNETALEGRDPLTVCGELLARLREGLPHEVEPDGFALTVKFPDASVQVVPVLRRGGDYLLPSDDSREWSRIRPTAFTEALTAANKACNGKVVPAIKLVKVLLSSLPDDRRPTGYHLENLAIEAFRGYNGPFTPRAMLEQFFKRAPELIRKPIVDKTGQSVHVDDALGPPGSVARLVVADAVDRVGRRLRNADGSGDIEQWRRLFGVSA